MNALEPEGSHILEPHEHFGNNQSSESEEKFHPIELPGCWDRRHHQSMSNSIACLPSSETIPQSCSSELVSAPNNITNCLFPTPGTCSHPVPRKRHGAGMAAADRDSCMYDVWQQMAFLPNWPAERNCTAVNQSPVSFVQNDTKWYEKDTPQGTVEAPSPYSPSTQSIDNNMTPPLPPLPTYEQQQSAFVNSTPVSAEDELPDLCSYFTHDSMLSKHRAFYGPLGKITSHEDEFTSSSSVISGSTDPASFSSVSTNGSFNVKPNRRKSRRQSSLAHGTTMESEPYSGVSKTSCNNRPGMSQSGSMVGERHIDAAGVPWLLFEYPESQAKRKLYRIRCDINDIDTEIFHDQFRKENCVYPKALVPPEMYSGHRQGYEMKCNEIGWKLVYLNPQIGGQRGLTQRAVDTYRNTDDLSSRSRRARRIARKQLDLAKGKN